MDINLIHSTVLVVENVAVSSHIRWNSIENFCISSSRIRQTASQQHGLEGTSEVSSPAQNRFSYLKFLSRWIFNISWSRDSSSPDHLFQCLTTIIKTHFPYFEMEFLMFQLMSMVSHPFIVSTWDELGATCWLLFDLSTRISRSFSAKLLFSLAAPGSISCHLRGTTPWFFHSTIPINLFLQPLKVSLNSIPALSPLHREFMDIAHKLRVHPILLSKIINQIIYCYWPQSPSQNDIIGIWPLLGHLVLINTL